MISRQRLAISGITLTAAVLAQLTLSPTAHADAQTDLATALSASIAQARTSGINVIAVSSSSRTYTPPELGLAIPGEQEIRTRWSRSPVGDGYLSIRLKDSNRLLGASGVNGAQGLWSTPSLASVVDLTTLAESRRWPARQPITNIAPPALPSTGLNAIAWGRVAGQPLPLVAPLGAEWLRMTAGQGLLAGGASPAPEAFQIFTPFTVAPGPNGATVYRAQAPLPTNEEDDCDYTDYTVTTRGGLVMSASWTEMCPRREQTVAVEYDYADEIALAPGRTISQDAILLRKATGQSPAWQPLAQAAVRTASLGQAAPRIRLSREGRPAKAVPAAEALAPVYALMIDGNPGSVRRAATSNGVRYAVNVKPGSASGSVPARVVVDVRADGIVTAVSTAG